MIINKLSFRTSYSYSPLNPPSRLPSNGNNDNNNINDNISNFNNFSTMHDQQKFHTDAVEKNSNKNKYDTSNRKHNNDGFNPIIQQPDDDPLNTRKSIGKQNLSGSVRKHHHNHHRRKKTLAHDRQKSIIDNGLTYEVQATSSNNRSVPVYSRKNSSNALNDNNPTKHKEFSGLKVITSKVQLPPLPLSSQSFIPSASPQIFGLHTFGSPIPFKQDNNNMNNSLREGSISSQNVPPHSPDNIPFSNPFSSRSVNFQRQASPGGFPASPTPSAGGMTVYDGSVGGVFPPPFLQEEIHLHSLELLKHILSTKEHHQPVIFTIQCCLLFHINKVLQDCL